jgi:hypothetical protein
MSAYRKVLPKVTASGILTGMATSTFEARFIFRNRTSSKQQSTHDGPTGPIAYTEMGTTLKLDIESGMTHPEGLTGLAYPWP